MSDPSQTSSSPKRKTRRVSITDISRKVGCTPATVSLVLNDSPLPAAKTRQRVLAVAEEMGYFPNRLAQSLKSGKTSMLGLIMPHSADPFYAMLIDAMNEEAERHGYQLAIHFHRWSTDKEERTVRLLLESRCEGILLYSSQGDYHGSTVCNLIKAAQVPSVGINLGSRAHPFHSSILLDYDAAAKRLGRFLAELGHRDIDYVVPALVRRVPGTAASERLRLFAQELLAGAKSVNEDSKVQMVMPPLTDEPELEQIRAEGFSSLRNGRRFADYAGHYLDHQRQGTVAITTNEGFAWQLMAAMYHRQLNCPRDLSVTCFAVEDSGASGAVPLTAMEYSSTAMARAAIAQVLRALRGEPLEPCVLIPSELVVRASVRNLNMQ